MTAIRPPDDQWACQPVSVGGGDARTTTCFSSLCAAKSRSHRTTATRHNPFAWTASTRSVVVFFFLVTKYEKPLDTSITISRTADVCTSRRTMQSHLTRRGPTFILRLYLRYQDGSNLNFP